MIFGMLLLIIGIGFFAHAQYLLSLLNSSIATREYTNAQWQTLVAQLDRSLSLSGASGVLGAVIIILNKS